MQNGPAEVRDALVQHAHEHVQVLTGDYYRNLRATLPDEQMSFRLSKRHHSATVESQGQRGRNYVSGF